MTRARCPRGTRPGRGSRHDFDAGDPRSARAWAEGWSSRAAVPGLQGHAKFGHQHILPDGPAANAAIHGCLEALARADAIRGRLPGNPCYEAVSAAARAGDERARQGLRDAGQVTWGSAEQCRGPARVEQIVISGGIAAAGELLLDPIRQEVERPRPRHGRSRGSKSCAGELGIWAGAIGAALQCINVDPQPSAPPGGFAAEPPQQGEEVNTCFLSR